MAKPPIPDARPPMRLGVCYYPEHWPEDRWATDARTMVDAGLTRVRMAEFAWSRIEPRPGQFDWVWLDRAIETLAAVGLGIVMATPTATPPKWLVDSMPDMLAVTAKGHPRKFGSRRHYCFSHLPYRREAARIARAVGERYGRHSGVVGWQIDNEYGCHDTTLSYSVAAAQGFQRWLAAQYASIEELNQGWGNVFWSMEYRSFAEIDLPNGTVTEANPAHWLDFRRYSSEQVVAFNAVQARILREVSPGRDVTHNFMGFYTGFDHRAVARDLDVVGWDSYPLGFLETFRFTDQEKLSYARQGHPDIAAFHHDLYRGCHPGKRWSVLEQQPGPVNWARYNPAPLPGMVRLWTLEAMAHGAELVSYFRWRQAPFGQEQMHAGLLRPDSGATPALEEVQQVASEIVGLGSVGAAQAKVAIVFDYQSEWVTVIQPQGADFSALWATFACYSALRKLGLDIDIVGQEASLDGYALVVLPCVPIIEAGLAARLAEFDGTIVIGPRSGSKTRNLAIPRSLAPGALQALVPAVVAKVESLRTGLVHKGEGFVISRWSPHHYRDMDAEFVTDDESVAVWKRERVRYIAAWPEEGLAQQVFTRAACEAGLPILQLPEGLRVRRTERLTFVFNYGTGTVSIPSDLSGEQIIGTPVLPPAGVAVFA